MENNWLRRRVLEKKNPGRQQPCWGSLFCTNLTQPTGALDSKSSRDVLRVIEKVNSSFKTTIIIITHNEAIAHMADTVVRIRDGKVADCIDNKQKMSADELEL